MFKTVFPSIEPEPSLAPTPEQIKRQRIKALGQKIKSNTKETWKVFQVTKCNCKIHNPKSDEQDCILGKWKYYDERDVASLNSFDTEEDAWIAWRSDTNWLLF